MKILLLAIILALCGCKPTPAPPHDVPNLLAVDPGVWRSGQPASPAAWAYLRSIGVKHVVKLNYEAEGSDAGASAVGIDVLALSIPPSGDLVSVVEKPSAALVAQAIDALRKRDGVLIHCTHGQDRTGLAIGIYRVLVDGRTKTEAYDEMRAIGFHPELVGLAEAWRDFDGKDVASIGR